MVITVSRSACSNLNDCNLVVAVVRKVVLLGGALVGGALGGGACAWPENGMESMMIARGNKMGVLGFIGNV